MEKEVKKKEEKVTKEYWVCPRCNNKNLINVMYCTLCKREQPF
jgi:hypothetical protein